MRWWPSWSKRRKAAADTAMACPTWAAWAGWTCKHAAPAAKRKGPAEVHATGPFSFCITLARERGGGMRILVAEDDAVLADAVQRSLRQSGHAVDWVQNGAQAEDAVQVENFDLLILDLGLPKKSGLDVLKRLRLRDSRLPVLILTAADGVSDRVRGLDAGADDYLAKPFDLSELVARVRALMRRGMAGSPTLLRHGALTYDQVGRVARLGGEPLELSAREIGLLEIFLQRAGRLVSKDQLVSHLCEWGEEVSANAIEVYVHRLRKKLEPGGVRIVTVRGLGYSLEKPVSPG